jgi:transposase InsO family protein
VVLEIRKTCLLPLDDLVCITQRFINPKASRSGIGRLLLREGVSKLSDLRPKEEDQSRTHKTFKDYVPGFVHVDIKYLPQMPDEQQRSYLFVAIDRATRWVYLRVYRDQSQASSCDFLRRLLQAASFKISKILTDNGTQFTDRFTSKDATPSGRHVFDLQCQAYGIEHRLIKPRHPQTNGMVERFNGRISEIVKQTRFQSAAQLHSTLNHYLSTYNHHIPQRALRHLSPIEALQDWYKKQPEIFNRNVYKRAGLDT